MSQQTENQPPMSAERADDGTTTTAVPAGTQALSEDEKARIRHEMFLREEIRRELAKAKSPERKYGVHPFLNSPFFLTAVCGLLASVIGHFYSRATAENERRLAQENAIREKRIALLSSVANDVPTYVSTIGSVRNLRFWLKAHKNGSDDTDEIGRPREEVYKAYSESFKWYLQVRQASSILAEVRSYFSKDVLGFVDDEERAIEAIEDASTHDEIVEHVKGQEKTRKKLLSAMAEEIRKR